MAFSLFQLICRNKFSNDRLRKIVSIIIITAVLRNVNPIRRIYTAFPPRVVSISPHLCSVYIVDTYNVSKQISLE